MNGPGPRDVAVRLQVSDLRARSSDVDPADRRCLDFVAYAATPLGEALCCDVTLVSPLTRDGRPQPSATTRDGAMISVAERRKRAAYHELCVRGSSAYASARAKLADAGVLNRSALSRNSCGFALLLPCAVQLPRVGCAAGGACSVLLCTARLLRRFSARHTSLGPCLVLSSPRSGTSCTMPSPATPSRLGA